MSFRPISFSYHNIEDIVGCVCFITICDTTDLHFYHNIILVTATPPCEGRDGGHSLQTQQKQSGVSSRRENIPPSLLRGHDDPAPQAKCHICDGFHGNVQSRSVRLCFCTL